MQLQQAEMQMKQAQTMENLIQNMQQRIATLQDENSDLQRRQRNNVADDRKVENFRIKCPKWKKVDSLDSFSNMAKVWDQTCKAEPGIKLIQFLEAIEEDHGEAYRRIKLETIDNSNFNKENENVIEECLKILKKHFGKTSWEEICHAWRELKDLKQNTEKISEYILKFENLRLVLEKEKIKIPEKILVIELLDGAKLTSEEKRMLGVKVDLKKENIYDEVKDALINLKGALVERTKSQEASTDTFFERGRTPQKDRYQYRRSQTEYDRRNRSRSNSYNRQRWSKSGDRRSGDRSGYKNWRDSRGERRDSFRKNRENSYSRRDAQGSYSDRNYRENKDRESSRGDGRNYNKESDDDITPKKTYVVKNPPKIDKDGIFNIFYTLTVNMMLLDCGAPKACTGKTWLNTYVDQLTEEEKSAIEILENNDAFAFGPSPTFKSTEKVRIPVKIGTVEHVMEVAVVNAEIPLLIGRDEMEKMDIVLHLKKREAYLGKSKETVKLEVTNSGHLGIQIAHNEILNKIFVAESKIDEKTEDKNDDTKNDATREAIEKVHKALGHLAKERLWSLFRNSGQYNEENTKKNHLGDIRKL